MSFSKITMIPLVSKLGDYFSMAFEEYVKVKATGAPVDVDNVALFIEEKMKEWDPQIKGKILLDPATRKAASRFVAGVAFNLSK
jgi:hypothetical protein